MVRIGRPATVDGKGGCAGDLSSPTRCAGRRARAAPTTRRLSKEFVNVLEGVQAVDDLASLCEKCERERMCACVRGNERGGLFLLTPTIHPLLPLSLSHTTHRRQVECAHPFRQAQLGRHVRQEGGHGRAVVDGDGDLAVR